MPTPQPQENSHSLNMAACERLRTLHCVHIGFCTTNERGTFLTVGILSSPCDAGIWTRAAVAWRTSGKGQREPAAVYGEGLGWAGTARLLSAHPSI